MDITVYAHTTGIPDENINKVDFYCLGEKLIKEEITSFSLISKDVTFEQIDAPKKPRYITSFRLTLKDVFITGAEGAFAEGALVQQNEFFTFLNEHRFTYYPTIKSEIRCSEPCYLQAAVIDKKIIGGNDISVLWDEDNHKWKAEWLYR